MGDRAQRDDDDKAEKSRHQRVVVNALCVASSMHWFAMMVGMQAERELMLRAFAGDFAGQARLQSVLASVSSLLGFFIGPLIGAMSDAIGRKPVMLCAPAIAAFKAAGLILRPGMTMVVLSQLLRPFTMTQWWQGEQAALGDMFKNDARALGAAQAKIHSLSSVNMIVCPIVGSFLARRDIRLPFVAGLCCYILNSWIAGRVLKETLPPSERRPFTWRATLAIGETVI